MSTVEHQRQILENQGYWDSKPVLHEIYREFHHLLSASLSSVKGETVELGSGIGNIREVIPGCVRTDLFSNPRIDRRENAYRLSMQDHSVANLILFDVFHHLEFPLAALGECRRVLAPGGRLLVFDHAMSLLWGAFSKLVHHERAGFGKPYSLETSAPRRESGYYADHANAHRFFIERFEELLGENWHRVRLTRLPALRWLLSGGYRGPNLLPAIPEGLLNLAERGCTAFPALFALRMLVVLESR